MATLPELKKKLKGIRSTEKLTKAMKTVSAAKYSKLSHLFSEYSSYSDECMSLYKKYESEVNEFFPKADKNAPPALFVFSSNKGLCGGFNTEIFNFTAEKMKELPKNTLYFPCGKKAVGYFTDKNIPYEKAYVFSDIPTSEEAGKFLEELLSMRKDGKISEVWAIFPKYINVMRQTPVMTKLFTAKDTGSEETDSNLLFIPDKKTVMESIARKVIFAAVYSVISETALGAQASTLTTMRSAYDTATAYSSQLEIQINRKRQSEVTSDVIESRNGKS